MKITGIQKYGAFVSLSDDVPHPVIPSTKDVHKKILTTAFTILFLKILFSLFMKCPFQSILHRYTFIVTVQTQA